jgi:hypothetical protein
MKIAEMRSSLDLANLKKGLPTLPESMPDFIVRNLFERRNGLAITPLPAEFLKKTSKFKTVESRKAQADRLLAEISAENDAELILKAQASLSLL